MRLDLDGLAAASREALMAEWCEVVGRPPPKNSMTANWIISGMVLKKRKDTGLEIAKWLGPLSMSGKAVYSDSAHRPIRPKGRCEKILFHAMRHLKYAGIRKKGYEKCLLKQST